MRFETLAAAQAYLDRWAPRWADTRIHGTTKISGGHHASRGAAHLQPLGSNRFDYAHGTRLVHVDGYVEVGRAYYRSRPGGAVAV